MYARTSSLTSRAGQRGSSQKLLLPSYFTQGGKVTGDKETESEGKGDQARSSAKKAGENIKDVFEK
jgi:hypothetical protein